MPPYRRWDINIVGEILLFFMIIRRIFFFFSRSFFVLCRVFFLFSVFLSIIIGFYHSGWIGILVFLVFIGGILIILFYLGMYGKYFNISSLGSVFILFTLLILPVNLSKEINIYSTGESSMTFFRILFLGGLAVLLFFLLNGIRKILGIGRAMRSFY